MHATQYTYNWVTLLYIWNTVNYSNKHCIQFSFSVMSDFLSPHGLLHTRPPCPSPTPRIYSNSIESVMPSNHLILCYPLLLLPSIFPNIRVFPRSQFFTSGGQSIGVSASASVLPMNIQAWFPLGWTGWIFLLSKGLSRVFSNTTIQNNNSSAFSFLYSPTLTSIHDHWKTIALTRRTCVGKVMSLLLNMLSSRPR